MTVEETLEALFQNDYADSNSNSSSNNIHESDSDFLSTLIIMKNK